MLAQFSDGPVWSVTEGVHGVVTVGPDCRFLLLAMQTARPLPEWAELRLIL